MATTKAKIITSAAKPADSEFADLRVIEFGVSQFMRINTVVIRPEGSVVTLTGKNRQGKTSVLRALVSAFAGKRSLPPEPIKRGADEARIWTILGNDGKPEITIEEVLTRKEGTEYSHKLTVTPADGRQFREPQAVLSRLYEPIAFAPFEFSRRLPKDQLEVVKALVPGVDFEAIAGRRKEMFDERTQVGRERDRAQARAAGIVVAPNAPAEEVDADDLVNRLQAGREHNTALAKRQAGRDEAAKTLDETRDQLERLQAQIATLRKAALDLETKIAAAPALPEPVRLEPIEEALRNAQTVNAQVAMRKQRDAARAEHTGKVEEYNGLTKAIEQLDADKAQGIAAAKLSVPGLALADEGLTLNGMPFEQASGREKLETAVRIGMAMNPDLKLIVAEEGSLLDDEGLAVLEALAERHGFLVVIEKVTNGEPGAFVIEDGALVS